MSAFLSGLQQSVLTGLCLQGSPYQVQADYLIAADGASSRVRKQLGIDMVGEAAMQHLVNIHFFSKDLWQHVKERPAMLYFVFSSQAIVVLVAHNLQEGEMVAQVSSCSDEKNKTRKDYTFRRQFNEKPSVILGCPGGCSESVQYLVDRAYIWWLKFGKIGKVGETACGSFCCFAA